MKGVALLILAYAEYAMLSLMIVAAVASLLCGDRWKAQYWLGGVILTSAAVFGLKR